MIRNGVLSELEDILLVYERARVFMKENGNPDQWGDNYPPRAVLIEDIEKNRLFVFEENGHIKGAFVFFMGDEPTYAHINGAWLDASSYGVIHRVANGGEIRGMLGKLLEFVLRTTSHLRIDTHRDNHVMQHVLEKNGFIKCGIIYLENGDERLAYERI